MTTAASEPSATLYRLWNARGRLLYVGITERGQRRIFEHAASKSWWSQVASQTFEHYATVSEAECRERLAIMVERPKYNKRDTYHWTSQGRRRAALWLAAIGGLTGSTLLFFVSTTAQSAIYELERRPPTAAAIVLLATYYVTVFVRLLVKPVGHKRAGPEWSLLVALGVLGAIVQVPSRFAMFGSGLPTELVCLFWLVSSYAIPLQLLHQWRRRDRWIRYFVSCGLLQKRNAVADPVT